MTKRKTSRGRRLRRNTALDDLEFVQSVAATQSSLQQARSYLSASYAALHLSDRQAAFDNLIWATQWFSQATTLRALLNAKSGSVSPGPYRELDRIESDFDNVTDMWTSMREMFRSAI